MINSIQNISAPLTSLPSLAPNKSDAAGGENTFKNYLLDSIRQVNDMQQQADLAVEKLATGGEITTAEVLTAVQKADIAFKFMLQVRNKLVQAFEEVQAIRV
ncbi:MAG: flagellar hook-basal body complex protein FliE [Thermoguttaceae bacterium]